MKNLFLKFILFPVYKICGSKQVISSLAALNNIGLLNDKKDKSSPCGIKKITDKELGWPYYELTNTHTDDSLTDTIHNFIICVCIVPYLILSIGGIAIVIFYTAPIIFNKVALVLAALYFGTKYKDKISTTLSKFQSEYNKINENKQI